MRRRAAMRCSATALVVVSTLLAGCGSSDRTTADAPAEPASTPSAAPSSEPPSPTPKGEPTMKPLSRFEDEAPVKVARKWAVAFATAVNDHDQELRAIAPLTTAEGLDRMVGYGAEDAGLFYPGPLPFTPVGVRAQGDSAEVPMCLWAEGFALDRKTKLPPKPRQIGEVALTLKKQGSAWRVDNLVADDVDCSRVDVKGRGW
ncbi:MAG TPA: hypothetical protein VFG72_16520 [Marmoricola sp.]|nr:hypothetical protein [Marmoricola sp.]